MEFRPLSKILELYCQHRFNVFRVNGNDEFLAWNTNLRYRMHNSSTMNVGPYFRTFSDNMPKLLLLS
jgi:hypothetical protein